MVESFSMHFEDLEKEKIASLPKAIIKNEKLQLKSEDSLLEFVIDLYKKDHSYSNLFESVLFSQVSEEMLAEFTSEIKDKYINDEIFQSICKRFFNKQEEVDPGKYIKEDNSVLTYGW